MFGRTKNTKLSKYFVIYFFNSTFMTELNYIGAVSAYSHGIKLSPKMAILYLNRSKAHIQIKNYHKAVEDATTVCIHYARYYL